MRPALVTFTVLVSAPAAPAQKPPAPVALPGVTEKVTSVAVSPDGTLAFASARLQAHFWDTATGKPLKTLELQSSFHSPVFTPDGKTVVGKSGESAFAAIDTATWKVKKLPVARTSSVCDLSADGKAVALASFNRDGSVVDVKTFPDGDPVFDIDLPDCYVTAVALSRDGGTLAALFVNDKTRKLELGLWSTTAKEKLKAAPAPNPKATAVALSPDGGTVFVTDQLAAGAFFDTKTGQAGKKLETGLKSPAFAADGKTVRGWYGGTYVAGPVAGGKTTKLTDLSGVSGGSLTAGSRDGRVLITTAGKPNDEREVRLFVAK